MHIKVKKVKFCLAFKCILGINKLNLCLYFSEVTKINHFLTEHNNSVLKSWPDHNNYFVKFWFELSLCFLL